jgi:ubiquinone/menaquinone biosynthesis C-methylase UbiE
VTKIDSCPQPAKCGSINISQQELEHAMVATDTVFAGSIPEIYDTLLVPMIFEPYAADLADRVKKLAPVNILETAAGTGALTRVMAAKLGADAHIVATDLNQPMLDRAASRMTGDKRILLQHADATSLHLEDAFFDVVVCQFGAMFFPDKLTAYKEARRVLKPGGTFLFNVWAGIADNAFAQVLDRVFAELYPANPTSFLARVPHGYHDAALIEATLRQAGFKSVHMETVDHIARAASARDVAMAYCQGTPLQNEIEQRGEPGLAKVTELVSEALARTFGHGEIEGEIEGPIKAHVFAAVK